MRNIKPFNWFFMKLSAIFFLMMFAWTSVSMWWLAIDNPDKYWCARMNTYGEWGIELVTFTILMFYAMLIIGIDLKQHWDKRVKK